MSDEKLTAAHELIRALVEHANHKTECRQLLLTPEQWLRFRLGRHECECSCGLDELLTACLRFQLDKALDSIGQRPRKLLARKEKVKRSS